MSGELNSKMDGGDIIPPIIVHMWILPSYILDDDWLLQSQSCKSRKYKMYWLTMLLVHYDVHTLFEKIVHLWVLGILVHSLELDSILLGYQSTLQKPSQFVSQTKNTICIFTNIVLRLKFVSMINKSFWHVILRAHQNGVKPKLALQYHVYNIESMIHQYICTGIL